MIFHSLSYPPESGVTKRTFHLLEETVRRHDTTVISFGSKSSEDRINKYFSGICRKIKFIDTYAPRWVNLMKRVKVFLQGKSLLQISFTERLQRVLDEVLREERYDLIFLSSPAFLYYRRPVEIPCISDAHNVEYDIFYRSYLQAKGVLAKAYFFIQYKLLKHDEVAMCARPDVLLTTSERDKNIFRQDMPNQTIHVVPNGVDLEYFAPVKNIPEPHTLVFCGAMNYLPNDHGIKYFLDAIFPLIRKKVPDVKIFIVGIEPSKSLRNRATEQIIVTGRVDDVRPYVARSQVYIIPLYIGGGTRLKALEAMAMKKPIVSTSIGCEGINLRNGESALFADTPEEFAGAVVQLFDNRELGLRLAERAYEIAVNSYSWHAIGDQLNGIFRSTGKVNKLDGEMGKTVESSSRSVSV